MQRMSDVKQVDTNNGVTPLDYIFRALAMLSVVEVGGLAYDIVLHPDAPGILSQGLLPRIVLGLIAGPSIILFSSLLLWRAPRNVVGQILLLLGVAEVSSQFAFNFGSPVVSALAFELFILFVMGIAAPSIAYLLLTFPTGMMYPPRWASWIKVAIAIKFLGVVLEILASQNNIGIFALSLNPLHVPMLASSQSLIAVTIGMSGILLPLMTLAGIVSLVLRYRAAEIRVRQQIKWVVWAPTVSMVGGFIVLVVRFLAGENSLLIVQVSFFTLAQLALLASLTIAILRYHLFDIDRLINRTLVYGLLTVVVIGLYGLIVGAFSVIFQSSGNYLIAFIATGLIAILFEPVQARLQRGVNRLMYGERDEPYAALSRLGQRLEASLAPDAVLPTIVETVAQALKLPYVAIELTIDDPGRMMQAVFPSSAIRPPANLVRLPLTYQNEPIGHLVLTSRAPDESLSSADLRLLADFARQASVAAHAVQLTKDLQRSRERLVMAREEERRRLRRDLHDGLGPALAAQVLKLGSARALLAQDSMAADKLLAELERDIDAALTDIRRLVYDLRPPVLDQLGLVTAIRQTATQYSASRAENETVEICVDAPEPLPSLPAAVEVAAFRIAQEALTNVMHHAHARACVVRIEIVDKFSMEISDDGRGLAPSHRAGVGLTSMRERAAELGGRCLIEMRKEGGTRVRVELPLMREGK